MGLRIPLCGELGMFAELKEVALDLQRSGLKRVKVRLEHRRGQMVPGLMGLGFNASWGAV